MTSTQEIRDQVRDASLLLLQLLATDNPSQELLDRTQKLYGDMHKGELLISIYKFMANKIGSHTLITVEVKLPDILIKDKPSISFEFPFNATIDDLRVRLAQHFDLPDNRLQIWSTDDEGRGVGHVDDVLLNSIYEYYELSVEVHVAHSYDSKVKDYSIVDALIDGSIRGVHARLSSSKDGIGSANFWSSIRSADFPEAQQAGFNLGRILTIKEAKTLAQEMNAIAAANSTDKIQTKPGSGTEKKRN